MNANDSTFKMLTKILDFCQFYFYNERFFQDMRNIITIWWEFSTISPDKAISAAIRPNRFAAA